MVDIQHVETNILRIHREKYGGGHRIHIGSTDKKPIRFSAQMLLDNPEVLKNAKFPFEAEIIDAPGIPDAVKELVQMEPDTTPKVKIESKDKIEPKVKKTTEKKFSKAELEAMNFLKLKKIGKKFGTTDRSKSNLIKEILKLQN